MRILAALVLYGRSAAQSETFQSLRDGLRTAPELAAAMDLAIVDNSPEEHGLAEIGLDRVTYSWNPSNPGLAVAYQSALESTDMLGRHVAEWLLLLDQDTILTVAYLHELARLAETVDASICAIVPKLVHNGGVHSPHFAPRLSHRGLQPDFTGVATREVSVFNSGALVRASALRAIGGFPLAFPLDFLDHATFHALQKAGGKIYIMQAALTHDLSTMQLGGDTSYARYRKVLRAERDFYAQTGGADAFWYRLRRLKQFVGHTIKVREKRFAVLDLQAALGLLGR